MHDPRTLKQQLDEARAEVARLKDMQWRLWGLVSFLLFMTMLFGAVLTHRDNGPRLARGILVVLATVGICTLAAGYGFAVRWVGTAVNDLLARRKRPQPVPVSLLPAPAPQARPQVRRSGIGRQTPIVNPEALRRMWRPDRD